MIDCLFQRREEVNDDGYPSHKWSDLLRIQCFSYQDRVAALDDIGTSSSVENTTTRLYFSTLFAPFDDDALKKVRPKDRCIINGDVYTLSTGAKTTLSPFTGAKTTTIDVVKQSGVYDGQV